MITRMKPKIPVIFCPKHGSVVANKNGNCTSCEQMRLKKLEGLVLDELIEDFEDTLK